MDEFITEKLEIIKQNIEFIEIYIQAKNETAGRPFILSTKQNESPIVEKNLNNVVVLKRRKK